MKSALIIGHAGHEMRVLKFIELFKPMVFILTDGSGGTGKSRIESSRKIFEQYGCEISDVFGYYSDSKMYEILLQENSEEFTGIKQKIKKALFKNNIDFVFGDAREGFNPTHDICRYLINNIVSDLKIKNYDFLLDSYPVLGSHEHPNIIISLSESDKQKRNNIIENYPEIQYEIEQAKKAMEFYGKECFDFECLREVKDYGYVNWKTDKPFYEIYAEKKLKEGKYKEIITFRHLLHIAENL